MTRGFGVLLAAYALVGVAAAGLTEKVCADGPTAPDDDVALLRATQDAFRTVAKKMQPYLVRIDTVGGTKPGSGSSRSGDKESKDSSSPRSPFRDLPGSKFEIASDGPTTGLVYSADGYIITSSFHFVTEPVLISVMLGDGRRLAADLIARDQVRKIALIKVDAKDLPIPPWKPYGKVRVGQWAVALGMGFGGEEPAVTVGIISALGRMHGNAVQTDAKLSAANYGGPVCDIAGRVVGLAVPMAQRPGELAGVELYDSGVGFAVPKHRIDAIVAGLKTGKSFYRGWLGMSIDPRVADAVVIKMVADPSPLLEAGVVPGDRLVQADGKPVRHYGQLVQALYMLPAGEMVDLIIERDGARVPVRVRLARATELGHLVEQEEPFDPAEPYPAPPDDDK